MGTWGASPFENDNASDWVWELADAKDTSVLSAALEAVISEEEEIFEGCEEAIAAAEVVAALRGKPLAEVPEEVNAFVKEHGKKPPDAKLISLAVTAVERIGKASDLKERWDESGDAKEWQGTLKDLLKRLGK
jgi:hypothetical protein